MTTLNNESRFIIDLPKGNSSIIKVIGVGGAGNNALKHMYERGIHGVDFIICNTDAQALDENPVSNKIQLGIKETEGLGAGADPEVGKRAAQESIDEIKEMLGTNTKMVFITAGMGGGTGTGAAPVIAKTAKDMGILTVAIVTVPFTNEGPRRLKQAEEGLEELKKNVDSLIVINNDKLRLLFGNLGFKSGFAKADEILSSAAKGMAEVITGHFTVNIDFKDANTVLKNSGTALMSEGIASGDNRAEEAVRKALDSPLLNDNKITGAKKALLLIRSGNHEVTLDEFGLIMDYVQKEAGNGVDIIHGIGEDEDLEDNISVLVIATGFDSENKKNIGTTERVFIPLDEHKEETSSIVSEVNQNIASQQVLDNQIQETPAKKEVFRLTDNDEVKPATPTNAFSAQSMQVATLEEVPMYGSFEDFEEDEANSISFEEEKSEQEYTLFNYDDLEPVSITFDLTDEPKEEHFQTTEIEEKSIDFSIREEINVPIQQEEKVEEKSEPILFEVEKKEEFTIVEKKNPDENPKVLERRNKLKEFNSRYVQEEAPERIFEIPTFRRRNVELNLENAPKQNISSFYSEQEGKPVLKENKFLNKDVD